MTAKDAMSVDYTYICICQALISKYSIIGFSRVLQTSTSPGVLSRDTAGLTSKTLLVFQDLDGATNGTSNEFDVRENVAKLIIRKSARKMA